MNENQSKSWYKKWQIWVAIVIVLGMIGYLTNPEGTQKPKDTKSDTSAKTTPPKQWTKVSELVGDTAQKSSDVFTVSGSNVRIKYTVNSISDSGTALLYMLPEGSTITKNSRGEMDVAVQDVTTIGNKSGELVVQKPAGNYYLYINTSSIKDYSITVDEQK